MKICELFSPHLSSSHLIPSLLTCNVSKVFSNVFVSSEHWQTFLISSKFVSSCSARQKALTVRKKSLAVKKTIGRRKFLHTDTWDTGAFTQKSLSEILCTTKLAQSTPHYYFVLQDLQKAFPSTTLSYKACTKHLPVLLCMSYKACTKHLPVLLCITKLAQSPSQYYFVLQDLQKAFPSTTLYYQACGQHYFVLQSLHKALSSTLYYVACASTSQYYFVLQSLRKSTAQYYFVLQSLHKALSSTLYYVACASTSQYYFVLQTLHTVRPSTTLYYNACAKKAFTHNNLFRRGTFTHSKLFKQRRFYTQKLLHTTNFYTEILLHTAHFHTQQAFTHRTLTHSAFTHGKRLHTHTEAFTQRHGNFYTQQVFAHKIFYTQQTFTEKQITQRNFLVHNHNRNCSSKTGSWRQSKKQEVPFIAGCSHFTQRKRGFLLRFPPQNQPHAKFMQPLQCVLRHYNAICIRSLQHTEEEPVNLETI